MLNASSSLGAQLDSLADFFNFNVLPALMIYLWKGHEIRAFGWTAALFFIICGALRLARFNVSVAEIGDEGIEEPENADLQQRFFVGMPVPIAAILVLVPMMWTFYQQDNFTQNIVDIPTWAILIYMMLIGSLMISRLPTLSFKKVRIRREYAGLLLAAIGGIIVGGLLHPWLVAPIVALVYLLLLPVGWWMYARSSTCA
jgi:CDP-diacylglycerol--serine O-phosphatidyltransferase